MVVARKTAKTATKAVAARTAETAKGKMPEPAQKPQFNWEAMPDAEAQEYSRGPIVSRVDIEATTPDVIKARVEESYDAYQDTIKNSDGSTYDKGREIWVTDSKSVLNKAGQESTRMQECGSEEMADEFLRLAKRYGKFRGMTVRGARHPKETTKVVYRAKPLETRDRG